MINSTDYLKELDLLCSEVSTELTQKGLQRAQDSLRAVSPDGKQPTIPNVLSLFIKELTVAQAIQNSRTLQDIDND